MMVKTICFFVLFLTAIAGFTAAEEVQCTDESAKSECAKQNRLCLVESNGEPACGGCVEGHVEWKNRELCVKIDNIQLAAFLKDYDPVYKEEKSAAERLELLKQAALFISQENMKNDNNSGAVLGFNKYSADSDEEAQQRTGFVYINVTGTENDLELFDTSNLPERPDRVDWVERGAVTYVKDQGRCGCCWGISLAGSVEGAVAITTTCSQSVSHQQYISCNEGNLGCDGGSLVVGLGYTWLNQFGGMSSLNDYEYTDYKGETTEQCLLEENNIPLAVEIKKPKIVMDFDLRVGFEERLETVKDVLSRQPISMVIKSTCRSLSNYRKGILTDDGNCACSTPDCLDHAILMVGYDDTHDPPYFKFKNSWGTGWGEDGYFRVAQTKKGAWGLFGILSHGVVPTVASKLNGCEEDEKQDVPLSPLMIIFIACGSGCILCVVVGFVVTKVRERNDERRYASDDYGSKVNAHMSSDDEEKNSSDDFSEREEENSSDDVSDHEEKNSNDDASEDMENN